MQLADPQILLPGRIRVTGDEDDISGNCSIGDPGSNRHLHENLQLRGPPNLVLFPDERCQISHLSSSPSRKPFRWTLSALLHLTGFMRSVQRRKTRSVSVLRVQPDR
ncbi:unnamed protein product [Spirodela intermedia]|uniref:Uncharacterized protein n=1 Tax=Spirodela intermedia TaxID=51605 RepID=A0A7I8KKQ4_SPIIN|nr:unnamed protein product [Spirodela intermedia]